MSKRLAIQRQRAENRGRRAEWLAALSLQVKGYQILARRARLPVGEIDLIAKRGKTVAFVEVKYRATLDQALIAVTDRNWQRIAGAAASWMARRPDLASCGWRYDIIAAAPYKWPNHQPDYWRP